MIIMIRVHIVKQAIQRRTKVQKFFIKTIITGIRVLKVEVINLTVLMKGMIIAILTINLKVKLNKILIINKATDNLLKVLKK